jgi:outer membrane biosynthesis protein TonB
MSGLMMPSPRDNRSPALLAAVALHAAVFLVVMFHAEKAPPPIGSSVPINIVSDAPFTDSRQAVQAPQTQTAATPQPTPEAKPAPPAPVEAPPAFTKTTPQPVKPLKPPVPQTAAHATTAATAAVDFNRMQQIIDNARHNTGAKVSGAQRGPARAETAPQARPDAGQGVSQSDLQGLQQLLGRLWILPCNRPEVGGLQIFKVTFTVTLTGRLLQPPTASGIGGSGVSDVVVRGALDAVRAAAPLPEQYYGQTITVNFNPKQAYESKCSD